MKNRVFAILATLFFGTISLSAQNQQPPDPEELAASEAIRLEKLLKLEPHQAFYVDSILRHDMMALQDEMTKMGESGMRDYNNFKIVQDKWINQIDSSLKQVMTPEQFTIYLKDVGRYKKEKKAKKKRN